ncbi:MAG: DUF2670 domain-containing protein [Rickettsiaceae bacterium]|nr:MAG: DUF2670 domain-containing protein [Rickettsiaceae bacterium]
MLRFIKKLISLSPMKIFIHGILGKWYVMILTAGLVVAFWVFKGLEQSGVLNTLHITLSTAIDDSKSIARYCVPKITDIHNFIHCIQNPPKYVPTTEEIKLQNTINNSLDKNFDQLDNDDPYDQGEN